jgi:glycerol-3-phosphate acyltransferase PlsX
MKIVVDAMGGDNAPAVVVEGTLRAVRELGVQVVLVGRREAVSPLLERAGAPAGIQLRHASQVVEMEEHPAAAVKAKPDSSMVAGMDMIKRGEAEAFMSAGNSGGVLAAALFRLGRIQGVRRPALSTIYPTGKGLTLILDIGANTDCKPEYLQQFGIMGSIYSHCVLGVNEPAVAILSNGEEPGKGSELVQGAFPLLQQAGIRFVGNIEGKDIPTGMADVVVTDGFTGNVVIKLSEGVAGMILQIMREEIKKRPVATVGAALARPAFRAMRDLMDYARYGGAPLLGVDGVVIVAHGRSNALAIFNAIRVAKQSVEGKLVQTIANGLKGAGVCAADEST